MCTRTIVRKSTKKNDYQKQEQEDFNLSCYEEFKTYNIIIWRDNSFSWF